MATAQDAIKILNSYIKRTGNPLISYARFTDFARKYVERAAEEDPTLHETLKGLEGELPGLLRALESDGTIEIDSEDDSIQAIVYTRYHADIVRRAYDKLGTQPELPFPTEDSLDLELPGSAVTVVDIKNDFVPWISRSEHEKPVLLRLMFPDGIANLIVASDLIPRTFIQHTVQKVRSYLRTSRNASYMHQKMISLFRGRELALKEMINSVLATPDQALTSITEPTDFTFQFWTQMSSNIIKEYAQKSDKLVEEHGFCQAAYCIGYYNVYYRGIQQKNLERDTALKSIEARLKRKPYAFTVTDMYNFTDGKGVPLVKKFPPESLHSYLEDRIKPLEHQSLPDLLRVTTVNKKDFYIGKEFVLPLVMERLFVASTDLKEHYANSWSEALKNDERPSVMSSDSEFAEDVRQQLAGRDSLLLALLRFEILYLCAVDAGIATDGAAEVNRLFDKQEKRLKPLPVLLELERETLYRDAMLLLPFWQAVPFLRGIVRFFQRVFLGRRKQRPVRPTASPVSTTATRTSPNGDGASEAARSSGFATLRASGERGGTNRTSSVGGARNSPGAGSTSTASQTRTRKQQEAAFRAAIAKLQTSFVPEGQSLEAAMRGLIEKWNPILEATAQKNLVEDVNSLVRDYVRRVKSGFRIKAPDAARIRNMAREVSEHEALSKIKKKDALREYVELYMLRILGK